MNVQVQAAEYRECFKCWFQNVTASTQCPKCGKTLYTSKNIRNRGIFGIIVGLFLTGFMVAIAVGVGVLLTTAMKNPESAKKINAEAGMLVAIYALFAMVIAFGLHSVIIGVYHVVTGKRSRVLIWIMWGLIFVILAGGGFLRAFL